MKTTTSLKLKLVKAAKLDLRSFQAGDTTLYTLDDSELREGIEVFVLDDEGNYIAAPDGEYPYDDRIYVVTNGVIDAERESNENPTDENMKNEKLKKPEKLEAEAVTVEDFNALVEVVIDVIDALETEEPALEAEAEEVKLSKRIDELEKELKLAQQTSNRDFANPNPTQKPDELKPGKGNRRESQLSKFGL